LLLSSDKDEYFEIRRELNKINSWLREGCDIDTAGLPHTVLRGGGTDSVHEQLQTIVKYLPELKQGWSEARSEGVQDYLTILNLGLRSGK
jgi:hypothetical protein